MSSSLQEKLQINQIVISLHVKFKQLFLLYFLVTAKRRFEYKRIRLFFQIVYPDTNNGNAAKCVRLNLRFENG